MSQNVLLSVFMEGTSNPLRPQTTQIAMFANVCSDENLSNEMPDSDELPEAPGCYKICFEGCGVSHGTRGLVFAHGLKEQCEVVCAYVEGFVNAGLKVVVNFLGLSRGGIGGLYLAQMLDQFPASKVTLHMCLFDPVPGNLMWMAAVDFAKVMNTNMAMDVSYVRNFGRVLALYPHEPLPDIALHAPLLPKYPKGCNVVEDVVLGCHQGALWFNPRPDAYLSFACIRDFMTEGGTHFDTNNPDFRTLNIAPDQLAKKLESELKVMSPSERFAHAPTSVKVVRKTSGVFLNRSHQQLLQKLGKSSATNADPLYMLDFDRSSSSCLC